MVSKEDNKIIKKSIQPVKTARYILKIRCLWLPQGGYGIIDLAREIRNAFKSIEELKKQEKTKRNSKASRKYTKLLSSCLKDMLQKCSYLASAII